MRKLLHCLFPLLALVVCVARPSRAEAPQLAVCKEGACWMSEADYRQLQAFAVKLREYAQNAQQVDEEKEVVIIQTRRRLESCEAWRDDHKSTWKR